MIANERTAYMKSAIEKKLQYQIHMQLSSLPLLVHTSFMDGLQGRRVGSLCCLCPKFDSWLGDVSDPCDLQGSEGRKEGALEMSVVFFNLGTVNVADKFILKHCLFCFRSGTCCASSRSTRGR